MPETQTGPVFIALEGLRGCGKSTIAPLLAQALEAEQIPTFPAEYTEARIFLDWNSRDPEARAHLFVSALLVTASRVKASRDLGNSVVIDSFAQRTAVTHRVFGAAIDRILPQTLPVPTTIHLECSGQERRTRLQQRNKPTTWWDTVADAKADQLKEEYSRFPGHRVDTTGRQPEQTVQMIIQTLTLAGIDLSRPRQAHQRVAGSPDPNVPHSGGTAPTASE